MAGRPKIFDEEIVIKKAANVFWEKGYEAASAEELLKAMGIGKGSFYLSFKGGKKELYEKAIRQFANNLLVNMNNDLASADNGIDYLKRLFLGMSETADNDNAKGCFMGNALVEMSVKDEYTKILVAGLLSNLEEIFTKAIQKAKNQGQFKSSLNAELLGLHLINLWNGLNVTRRMYPNGESVKELIKLNLKVLE